MLRNFNLVYKDRKRAFEIYKEMCNYKKAEKIKRDIINYVEDSPKFVQRSRNIVTNLELEPSGTIDESYNVNAQDDEKPKKIITPETEKLLLNFQQGKLDNISLVKEVQKEQEIKNQNKIYLSELIKQQKEIKDEPKDKIKEKLQQNPEFRQIERQINVHKSIVNADASEKKNLSITREKEMESRKKLSELEKKKEEFYNNEKKNLPDVNNNFPL